MSRHKIFKYCSNQ